MAKDYKDAFGGDLIIGNLYGYVSTNNGYVRTTYGELKKVSDKGYGTIEVEKRFTALYADPVKESQGGRDKSFIKCNQLVPYNIYGSTEKDREDFIERVTNNLRNKNSKFLDTVKRQFWNLF